MKLIYRIYKKILVQTGDKVKTYSLTDYLLYIFFESWQPMLSGRRLKWCYWWSPKKCMRDQSELLKEGIIQVDFVKD